MNPQQCCLACSFKNSGISKGFIEYMLVNRKRVSDFYNIDDQEMKHLIKTLAPDQKIPVLQLVQLLSSVYGQNTVPLLHPGYYQKQVLQASVTTGEGSYNYGSVEKGQVLELLFKQAHANMIDELLEQLFNESQELVTNDQLYKDIDNVPTQNSVSITVGIKSATVKSTDQEDQMRSVVYDYNDLEELNQLLTGRLSSLDRISLVLVKVCPVSDQSIGSLAFWMELFKTVFVDINKIAVVLAIDCNHFNSTSVLEKQHILHTINHNVDHQNINLTGHFVL